MKTDPGHLARCFDALAHPVRLQIFAAVRRHCCVAEGRSLDCCGFHVSDLYELVEVAPSTVSHHLAALKASGLIVERRAGKFLYLTIGHEAVANLIRFAHGETASSAGHDPCVVTCVPPSSAPPRAALPGATRRKRRSP